MMYWFGLGLSLVTSALFIVSIRQVEKSRVFLFQAIETSINIVKNIVLGGFSGAVTQVFALIRNVALTRGYSSWWLTVVLSICQLIGGIMVNQHGWLGLLPMIASISYTVVSFSTTDILTTKYALFWNISMWMVYDVVILDWVAVAMSVVFLVTIAQSIRELKLTSTPYEILSMD